MAVNEDAERLMKAWERQSQMSERRGFDGVQEALMRELQGKGLLSEHAHSMSAGIGEYVVRFASHGGPVFTTRKGELIFTDQPFAEACVMIYARSHGRGYDVLKIVKKF